MPITLDQPAKLEHINIRKEGPDGEKHLMVDLKLAATVNSDTLLEFDPTLRAMLFRESAPRFPKMAPIRWQGEMRHMELEIAGAEFLDVTLRKFVLEPLSIPGAEYVAMTFVATFAPGGRETAILAEQVGEETPVKITAGRELDLAPSDVPLANAVHNLNQALIQDGATLEITTSAGTVATLGAKRGRRAKGAAEGA